MKPPAHPSPRTDGGIIARNLFPRVLTATRVPIFSPLTQELATTSSSANGDANAIAVKVAPPMSAPGPPPLGGGATLGLLVPVALGRPGLRARSTRW